MTQSLGDKPRALQALIREGKELSRVDAGGALRKWRDAVEIAIELYGTTSSTTLFCQNSYAQALLDLNVMPEALTHFQRLLTHYESESNEDGDSLVGAYQSMADVYARLAESGKSLNMWRKAYELSLKLHGDAYSKTRFCERKIASTLMKVERYHEALPILKRHLAGSVLVNSDSRSSAMYARDVGFCLNGIGRFAAALHYLKQAKEILEATYPEDDPALLRLHGSLHWTRKRIAETQEKAQTQRRERLEFSRTVIKSEAEREMLRLCSLTPEQSWIVLTRLSETYAKAENANQLRMIRKSTRMKRGPSNRARYRHYQELKATGVGTAHDEEFFVEISKDDGADVVVVIGYHAHS